MSTTFEFPAHGRDAVSETLADQPRPEPGAYLARGREFRPLTEEEIQALLDYQRETEHETR